MDNKRYNHLKENAHVTAVGLKEKSGGKYRVDVSWIEYVRHSKFDTFLKEKGGVSSEEPPHPDIEQAISVLSGFVATLCQLRTENWELSNPIEVTSVKVKYDDENHGTIKSLVLSVKRYLDGREEVMNFNTPSVDEAAISDDVLTQLSALFTEAKKYAAGKRKQLEMFTNGSAEGEDMEVKEGEGLTQASA